MEKSPHAPLCERGDLPEASIDSVMTTQPFLPSTKIAIDPLPHQDKILSGLLNIPSHWCRSPYLEHLWVLGMKYSTGPLEFYPDGEADQSQF